MKTKTLNVEFDVKSIDEKEGYIEGYASTFGNIDLGGDIVDRGAFKKTIRENKGHFAILSNHNPYMQIGWNEEAREDDTGLWVKGWLDIKNIPKAKEHFSLIQKAIELKVKSGLSIGYSVIKAEPDKENPTLRRLKELRLYEYSPVTFPMNTEAAVTHAKSLDDCIDLKESVAVAIESLRQKGYSDLEIFDAIKEHNCIEDISSANPGSTQWVDDFFQALRA